MSKVKLTWIGLRLGDMVFCTTDSAIGILTDIRLSPPYCSIMVAQNVTRDGYHLRHLRQAMQKEIREAGLEGVGCNEYRGE